MSLADCLGKARNLINIEDSKAITARALELNQQGMDQDTAEKQAVQEYSDGVTKDFDDVVTQIESKGHTFAREKPEGLELDQTVTKQMTDLIVDAMGFHDAIEKVIINADVPGWVGKKRPPPLTGAEHDEYIALSLRPVLNDEAAIRYEELYQKNRANEGLAKGEDILARLNPKQGIKAEHREFMLIDEFLLDNTYKDTKFTRGEVLKYIREHRVNFKERVTTFDENSPVSPEKHIAAEEFKRAYEYNWEQVLDADNTQDTATTSDQAVARLKAELAGEYDMDFFDSLYNGEQGTLLNDVIDLYKDKILAKTPEVDRMVLEMEMELYQEEYSHDTGSFNEDSFFAIWEQIHNLKIEEVDNLLEPPLLDFVNAAAETDTERHATETYIDEKNGLTLTIENESYEIKSADGKREYASNHYNLNEAQEAALNEIANEKFVLVPPTDERLIARWGEPKMVTSLLGKHTNYREIKITLPDLKPIFRDPLGHNKDGNVVVFARVSDRVINGKKTLFIEEVQSDLHQIGRQYGYVTKEEGKNYKAVKEESLTEQKRLEKLFEIQVGDIIHDYATKHKFIEKMVSTGVLTDYIDTVNVSLLHPDEKSKAILTEMSFKIRDELLENGYDGQALIDQTEKTIRIVKGVPDALFKGNKGDYAAALGVRTALIHAAKGDYESVAWPDAGVMSNRWSSKHAGMYTDLYNKKILKQVNSLKVGTKPEHFEIGEQLGEHNKEPFMEGYFITDISDQFKNTVNAEGLAFLQDKRGFYRTGDRLIGLTEASDNSTFLHEFAHFMYDTEMLRGGKSLVGINKWLKRNAADVAAEANGYKSFTDDDLQQAPVENKENAARKRKAEAMGYDTSTVYYHGSSAHGNLNGIKSFKRSFTGTFFSENPAFAGAFATGRDTAGAIYPVYLKKGKFFDYENISSEEEASLRTAMRSYVEGLHGNNPAYDGVDLDGIAENSVIAVKKGDWAVIEGNAVQDWIKRNDYQSYAVSEEGPGAKQYKNIAVLNPVQARSVHAEFKDPVNEDLLAQTSLGQGTSKTGDGPITKELVIQFLDNGTTGNEGFDAKIIRAAHEQFARGFEAYVMEGNAPSMEMRNVFRVMSRLLRRVYDLVFGGLDSPKLDDEMRDVYARLLATDEQIAIAHMRNATAPLFTDAVMVGMTEEQYATHLEDSQKETDKEKETVREKLMKELKRVQEQWWIDERQEILESERERLSKELIYIARERILSGKGEKLDYQSVIETLGVKNLMNIRSLYGMTEKGGGGISPDVAAPVYGYGSGRQFLNDLMAAPPIEEVALANANSQMLDKYGELMKDGSLEALVDEAVRGEGRAEIMLKELKHLSRFTKRPVIDRDVIKTMAQEEIESLSYSEIRPAVYRRAEIRYAQEAAVALEKGDKDAAQVAKTYQVMNFYLGKYATESRKFAETMPKLAARLNKKSTRARIGKSGNGHLEQMEAILDRFELRQSVSLAEHQRNAPRTLLKSWVMERAKEGEAIELSEEVVDEGYKKHWRETPIKVLKGLKDSLTSIEHNSRSLTRIQLGEENLSYEQVIDRLLNKADTVGRKHFIEISQGNRDGDTKKGAKSYIAAQIKIPWLLRWMDGNERIGIHYRAIMEPINNAYNNAANYWNEIGHPILEAFNNRSAEDKRRHHRMVDIPELAEAEGVRKGQLRGDEIIAVALNVGNYGNLRNMLLGEGWAKSEEEVSIDNPVLQAILKHLTDDDWVLVQTIWDQLEKLKPELRRVHKVATGLDMVDVEAVPFITPTGRVMRGGYLPIKRDSERDPSVKQPEVEDAESLTMLDSSGFITPTVTTGAHITRTNAIGKTDFSLDILPNHIQEVIHFTTHYEAVKQVNKIISDERVVKAMRETMGIEKQKLLKPWLVDVANDGKSNRIKDPVEKVVRHLRFGATYAIMGAKLMTIAMQPAGLANSMAELGKARVVRAFYKTMTGGSEQSRKEAIEFAMEKSKTLAHRMHSMDREIKNVALQMRGKSTWMAAIQRGSLYPIGFIQLYTVDIPTWYAGYEKGMQDFNGDEARAIQYADFAVEQIQGSGLTKDMSAFMRSDSEYQKALGMFMTFFSALVNSQADIAIRWRRGEISLFDVINAWFMMWIVPSIYETLLREGIGDEDDDDDASFVQRVAATSALMPLTGLPGVNMFASGLFTQFGFNPSPIIPIPDKFLSSLGKVLPTEANEDKEWTAYDTKNILTGLMVAGKIPGTSQIFITYEGYKAFAEGEELSLDSMRHLLLTRDYEK